MKDEFGLFCKDVEESENQRRTAGVKKNVLIGSPGVGELVDKIRASFHALTEQMHVIFVVPNDFPLHSDTCEYHVYPSPR